MATEAELRTALEWETDAPAPPDKGVWEWLWEAIQGDFKEDRSTGQVAFDAAVSMIPIVDQLCDVRDIIANCRSIATSDEKDDNTWKWVALVLTLIGLFPSLGSLVKGVLKIFFLFIRRWGLDKLLKAVDEAMTWVITLLRKREVQKLLRKLKVDEVFKWLADQVRVVKGLVTPAALLKAFDRGINLLKRLLSKVTWIPKVGARAQRAIDMVLSVRKLADRYIGKALEPVQRILDAIIHRLDMEAMVRRSGILDAKSVHFRGTLPEARAVTLMRETEPPPKWLSKGRNVEWPEQSLPAGQAKVVKQRAADADYPELSDTNIRSFHSMSAVEIKGPAKLYRVTSPSNGAMGDCWVPEDVWHRVNSAPDPKAAWRKYSAVWPDWNPNGQFVVLEIPAGQSVKAWQGPAASQVKKDLPNLHLEGGWDQVIIKVSGNQFDTTRYYMRGGGHGEILHPPGMSRAEWLALSPSKRSAYTPIRERINHPDIKGPMDTGWGTTDFDAQLRDAKIGLPSLPGQVTT